MHVADTGVGISEADLPNLFTQFGKLHRTAQMNSDGIGLGLHISQKIVELAGGKIEATSEGVNKGSCFIFSMRMD